MNNFIFILFAIWLINEWTGCVRIGENFEPIVVYSFHTSKFQVKDIIDYIVKEDTTVTFQKLSDYIDTFIFERSFCLIRPNTSDSIKYFYYFSGDVKEWLTKTDSTLLVLSYISMNGNTYDIQTLKTMHSEKMDSIFNFFTKHIFNPTSKAIKTLHKYDIRIINLENSGKSMAKGVICKEKERSDTLLLKYIDGDKYTGIPLVN